MKVNMTPNPLDVVTIHASQGDTEARQWEFELHNNGELIDTSDVKEQLVFKAYKGGTEQLLPENTSTPTTSPFIGDIKYPQGLLTDQEFTYRQSPTEEDGLAKITDIKGNTLVWNQLVQNGNFADKSNWIESNATFTVNNNIATMMASASYGAIEQILSVKANHMYFATCDIKLATGTNLVQFRPYVGVSIPCASTTEWQTLSGLFIPTTSASVYYPRITDSRASGWDAIQIRNCMVIDLTQMGLDISNPSDFTSLFPLSYYSYNQGTLLSFNGNGIKTVSEDETEESTLSLPISTYFPNGMNGVNDVHDELSETGYVKRIGQVDLGTLTYTYTQTSLRFEAQMPSNYKIPTSASDRGNMRCAKYSTNPNPLLGNGQEGIIGYQNSNKVFISDQSTTDPAVFKTMMNGVVLYYELKAPLENYGVVDLGTLNWMDRSSTVAGVFSATDNTISYAFKQSVKALCAKYSYFGSVVSVAQAGGLNDKTIALYYNETDSNHIIYLKDTSFSDVASLKSALSGVYLLYEKENPQGFTTATLVTENGEVALANENGVLVGKCNSDVSADAGFIEGKIKLSDEDGDVYSNKIQIHVERKPS